MAELSGHEIRTWLSALTTEPLPANDPRYVEFFEPGTTAIDKIGVAIKFAEAGKGSVNLFSGPRGSGKTTELLRFQKELEAFGFEAFVVDILDYINPSSPVDVTQFLLAFGLSFADEVSKKHPNVVETGGDFYGRFIKLVKRLNLSLNLGGVEVSASADGLSLVAAGQKVELDLKRELKGSEAFVSELRNRLSFHLGELRLEVAKFCAELASQISPNPVVFIIDSMEKFRGTTENDAEVQASVEALFVHHAEKLVFENLHVVYTVPPFLRIRHPSFAMHFGSVVRVVAAPKVRNADGTSVDAVSFEKFRTMLNRRVPMGSLFADAASVDRLIVMSGGNLRDLVRLTKEAITISAARRIEAPLGPNIAELAIEALRREYTFTAEDRDFLRKIHVQGHRPEVTEDEVPRFARLLDTEVILGHLNGSEWFEVHPLALEAVTAGT
jgi:DNA polymerase III delta prime subunit